MDGQVYISPECKKEVAYLSRLIPGERALEYNLEKACAHFAGECGCEELGADQAEGREHGVGHGDQPQPQQVVVHQFVLLGEGSDELGQEVVPDGGQEGLAQEEEEVDEHEPLLEADQAQQAGPEQVGHNQNMKFENVLVYYYCVANMGLVIVLTVLPAFLRGQLTRLLEQPLVHTLVKYVYMCMLPLIVLMILNAVFEVRKDLRRMDLAGQLTLEQAELQSGYYHGLRVLALNVMALMLNIVVLLFVRQLRK